MKRYSTLSAIIGGIFLVGFLLFILPANIPGSGILVFLIYIVGGFTATYLSKTNKAIFGFYEGLAGSIFGYLPVILIFRSVTSIVIILMIINPILGFLGGYIAKSLRLHLNTENNQDSNN
ncbi:hypothetical protein [Methanobacterium spitsbergense]|uniref:DUF5518 domain-containing protein n=1 Tax=Methanobacterium spitsbergense TaxID=2874285 RepID=A0A8T5UYC1_9EURY|nr:hypothetical protein [Methanobacterium spitsbergense]MBZ2165719.1 hypothetical protein [Methanobacterium spitsbergense]